MINMENGSTVIKADLRSGVPHVGVVLAESHKEFVVWSVEYNEHTDQWWASNGDYYQPTERSFKARNEALERANDRYNERRKRWG